MASLDQIIETILAHPEFSGKTFDAQAFIASLDEQALELLYEQILADEERERFSRFARFFPDEGPYRRALYPKHTEFFAAGAAFMERLFMAGNRCITPWTYIETPAGSVLSAELMTSTDPHALSWDGGSQCVQPMRDGMILELAPAFRVHLDNGRFFDCNRRHRVLTTDGWISLDQLVSRADGLRWWQTHADFLASCVTDGHLGDQPLLRDQDTARDAPPSQADALRSDRLIFAHADEAVRKFRHSHACRGNAPLSSPDDLARCADLFAPFRGAATDTPVLSLTENSAVLARLAAASSADPRSWPERLADQFRALDPGACPREVRAASDSLAAQIAAVPAKRLFPVSNDLHWIGGLSLHDGQRTAMFFPSSHIPLIGGNRILCVVPIGFQPIIDAHVPGTNCYIAGGVVHHNTGKTISGAYETTAHLTGQYPHWWEGRVFPNPIAAWVAGDTNETTRDILQKELLGEVTWGEDGRKTMDGSGMIPRECIGRISWKRGVDDLVDKCLIKHRTGRWSNLAFKSYDQGRRVFQGTAKHLIWLDEECPMDVYGECLIRLATTRGLLLSTFTPLKGLSEVVLSYMPEDMRPAA